jgi:hypothetical protein
LALLFEPRRGHRAPALAASPPCRDGHVTEPLCSPCRGIPLAPCRDPGQECAGPTSGASLAAAHGVEPCAAVAPPRHPSRARAETPARSAQAHQRTPVHTHLHFTPPYPAREKPLHTAAPHRRRAHAGDRRARRTPAALAVSEPPTRGARVGAPCRPATQASMAITAGETPRAAALFSLGILSNTGAAV